MVMLNNVYSTLAGDYKVRRQRTGRFELWVRPNAEPWSYVMTYDSAQEAAKDGELMLNQAEVMSRFDDYNFGYC